MRYRRQKSPISFFGPHGRHRIRARLHKLGGYGSQCFDILFTASDSNHPVERLNENLTVADLTGARAGKNCLNSRLDEWLRDGHFDPDLVMELEKNCRAAVLFDDLMLTAVAAHPRQGHSRNPDTKERLLYGLKALWSDDSDDVLHLKRLREPSQPVKRFLQILHDLPYNQPFLIPKTGSSGSESCINCSYFFAFSFFSASSLDFFDFSKMYSPSGPSRQ